MLRLVTDHSEKQSDSDGQRLERMDRQNATGDREKAWRHTQQKEERLCLKIKTKHIDYYSPTQPMRTSGASACSCTLRWAKLIHLYDASCLLFCGKRSKKCMDKLFSTRYIRAYRHEIPHKYTSTHAEHTPIQLLQTRKMHTQKKH